MNGQPLADEDVARSKKNRIVGVNESAGDEFLTWGRRGLITFTGVWSLSGWRMLPGWMAWVRLVSMSAA